MKLQTTLDVIKFLECRMKAQAPFDPETPYRSAYLNNCLENRLDQRLTTYQLNAQNNVKVLVSVSGLGKTRQLLELLYSQFGYYFVVDVQLQDFGSADMSRCFQLASNNPSQTQDLLETLYFVRMFVCDFLMKHGYNRPSQILLAQLHPTAFFGCDIFADLFDALARLPRFVKRFTVFTHRFPFVAIDDIQGALEGRAVFSLPRSQENRPFLSPLVYYSKHMGLFPQFIVSGTGFNFDCLDELLLAGAMKADQVTSYEVISGLDLLDTHAVELHIRSALNERKLDLDFIQSVVALFATNPLFLGRGQFIAFILDSITSNELPHQAISRFLKGLTEPQSPLFPLKYYAEELKNRPSDVNNLGLILRMGLIEFLFKGSATFRVQNQQALDMIHYGFGFPQVIDGRIQTVELQELATVESLRRLIPVSDLVPDICVRLSTFPKPQCAGYVLEYLVGMALVMNLKAEATKNLKSTRGNLAAYLRVCDADEICFPDHCCGPDIVYKLGDVVYLIQINFVDEISKQERVDACSTTEPMSFYTNKNTGRVLDGWTATKEAVLHELKESNCQIRRLIFLHTLTKAITDMDGVEVINQTNYPTFFDKLNPQLWNMLNKLRP
ncbi:hypothetical protein BCR33DRAFT_752876 [Rhizoclosmatium globosum]|uniref:Uncharacterized protein n=1 Tax=Rhizoclosmatium globosum TaxID=329046 RepID=A0A1Y2CXB0_9FUNG|nr:hypothetical protein BCR33DRAFT_752876 [Rhizoclosmatium globosum]|eukprot:ORY51661.1 hypothetical protein BCR33DRAFT_752876 [Rhizoclosmatium globosum]